jgi:hypothetical protein
MPNPFNQHQDQAACHASHALEGLRHASNALEGLLYELDEEDPLSPGIRELIDAIDARFDLKVITTD